MLKEKMNIERRKAILFELDLSGPIEQYAMAWLKLTNNAREYPDYIWKIVNSSSSTVYVYCNPKHVDSVRDFLDGLHPYYDECKDKLIYMGKILNEEEIIVGVPVYEWKVTGSFEEQGKDIDNIIDEWICVQEDY